MFRIGDCLAGHTYKVAQHKFVSKRKVYRLSVCDVPLMVCKIGKLMEDLQVTICESFPPATSEYTSLVLTTMRWQPPDRRQHRFFWSKSNMRLLFVENVKYM